MIIERLKKLRKEGKLTQKDIATFLNISQPAYQQFESGKKKMNLETMEKLADYFNVSTDYLLGKTDIPDPDLEVDIDKAIDNSVAYDGTPITDNDRMIIKDFLKEYFTNKK
ncbi:helix-turn-helix domain-containing protein [Streptococcus oralis]|jgi:HTH-type transcriptional regulator xre|uniref:HTH-type transcriptional regulator Xre n=1 Tax=Streptococcus oralis TaxID=1303 RepID=A0A3R9JGC9_STROR|nr:helix-turn-helix transcriptional regulator [Streptococcus oralis]MCY7083780.1 helix-turn-helix domain-containing protein [Streptococcus oralis]RSI73916.1 HTH-type transcriptional regulator Xre [Streptococcus oralis]